MQGFEGVWSRILRNAGDEFTQIQGKVFTYGIQGNGIVPSTTNTVISKSQFQKAWHRMPVGSPADLQDLWGPSYLYAILTDPRIRSGADDFAFRFTCAKCGNRSCTLSQLRGSSSAFMAMSDYDDQVMTLVTCKACSYSELYRVHIQEFKERFGLIEDEFEDSSEQ